MSTTFVLLSASLCLSSVTLSVFSKNVLDITTDGSTLLDFKAGLRVGPDHILAKNWSSSAHVCSWAGITCGPRHNRVTGLNVSGMDLSGTIFPGIGKLSFLVSLDLSSNGFHGGLPSQLSELKRLRFLLLDNCSFAGSIPSPLFDLSKLETLGLSYNSLDGKIPEEIGNLKSLRILTLRENKLLGEIPSSFFNVSTLEKVDLTYNNISGVIPDNICMHSPNLLYFSVFSNQMHGLIPSAIGNCSKLQSLVLQFNRFEGPVPKEIGNLTDLVDLYLGDNDFKGLVPRQIIGNLGNLELLSLDEVGLRGPISSFIYNMSALKWLYLAQNNLTGNLPFDTCLKLPSIQGLYLGQNQLSGSIPRELSNCSSLVDLYLDANSYTGEIPSELGELRSLEVLVLGTNLLTGQIPASIFNVSTLRTLSVRENRIAGRLPADMGLNLPNLGAVFLGQNDLTGPLPSSVSNATSLNRLSLVANKLTGEIPNSLGELKFLDFLNLGENDFTSESSEEMSFLASLTRCRLLRVMWIQNNSFEGYLPRSMANFSSALEQMDASNSGIKGRLPREIGNVSSLQFLYLDNNKLTGEIPVTFGGLKKLQALSIIGNELNGAIPESICMLSDLGELTLSKNRLSGPLVECLGNMSGLRYLNIDSNELNSSVSPKIGNLAGLLRLNLFSNRLIGQIPQEIGSLKAAISLDLSSNELSGEIPSAIVGLQSLINLSLADNRFQGPIPDSLGKMLSLERLDLSRNNLTGAIPKSMEELQYLTHLNLSFNRLTGEIPSGGPFAHFFSYESFESNAGLCGGPPRFDAPPCKREGRKKSRLNKPILIPLSVSLGAVVIIALIVLVVVVRRKKAKKRIPAETNSFDGINIERVSKLDLERATNGFSEANLLGAGSFGAVYRGVLTNGAVVAVKVFSPRVEGAFNSFDRECEVLRSVRHRNLTKVLSSCSTDDFRALVLEYMPNGSLEKWLYGSDDEGPKAVLRRLNISIDVASALEYLHGGYETPVVHCDLKPSNVLLDEDMVAHVSDFGIAKLVSAEDSVEQTKTLATFGYIAPEYGSEGLVSTRCDVYSFGIVLMETFTRKSPRSDLFDGEMSLRSWVDDAYSSRELVRVMDAALLGEEREAPEKNVECVSLVMKAALDCCAEAPGDRPSMKDTLVALTKIKNRFFPPSRRR